MEENELIIDTLSSESESIKSLINDGSISEIRNSADVIANADDIVAFSGVGKSGDVAKKIVSTFNSVGTPSYFLHPVEALHGDVGMLSEDSVIVLISNSGNTDEMTNLLNVINEIDPTTISITSDPESELGIQSDHHINTRVSEEGGVVEMVPMASATTTMVIGDCLANVLMLKNNFDERDFATYHPGGTIGKKLDFDIGDLPGETIAPILPNETLIEASLRMSEGEKGIVVVVDDSNKVLGVVTDGDLRREINKGTDAETTQVRKVMSSDPTTMIESRPAIEALRIMENEDIGQVVLTNHSGEYRGVVHMRELVREGIA
jgi:arabinose-5-phosphate isomerase